MNLRQTKRNLTPFQPKMAWDERATLIRRTFTPELMGPESPETEAAWKKAFDRDPELMGRILRDILKAAQAPPGRPGPRPALDAAKAQPVVEQWMGKDPLDRPYTTMPFAQAFTMLAGRKSRRVIERMTGMPRMTVHRLMCGEIAPTSEMMVKVAQTFNKQPSFFLEWRVGAIASAIVTHLIDKPDRSVRAYEALFWAAPSGQEQP